VIDGNYGLGGRDDRLRRADAVVVVEASLMTRLGRVVRKRIVNHRRERRDLAPGYSERLDASFVWWLVNWHRRHRDFAGEIRAVVPRTPVCVVRTPTDVDELLAHLRR